MGTLVIVESDAVTGTDKHNVQGDATNPGAPPPTIPYVGIGDYSYTGSMTDSLSDFVNIDGQPVATVGSKSSLDPGEDAFGGGHHGASGSSFIPPAPSPIAPTLSITDSVGEGTPSATAGSSFASVDGEAILLNGDSIDTCDGLSVPMNSTVAADNQDFVSCSE